MSQKFVYDYYDVIIPRDAIPESEGEDHTELFRLAFLEAEHRTRLYVSPCQWDVGLIDSPDSADYHVRVRRKRHKVKRPHFHMLIGMPGYMPATNYTFLTRGEAQHCARWEAQNFRDDWDIDDDQSYYKVTGNKYDGYEIYNRHSIFPDELYMTIRVTECFEEDCLEEMEDHIG